jgi:predicted signal transduction protein with EAL and GGDEF domain
VETEEQVNFLKAQHCDEAQGYYFGKPTIAADFAKLLGQLPPAPPQPDAYDAGSAWNQHRLVLVK